MVEPSRKRLLGTPSQAFAVVAAAFIFFSPMTTSFRLMSEEGTCIIGQVSPTGQQMHAYTWVCFYLTKGDQPVQHKALPVSKQVAVWADPQHNKTSRQAGKTTMPPTQMLALLCHQVHQQPTRGRCAQASCAAAALLTPTFHDMPPSVLDIPVTELLNPSQISLTTTSPKTSQP